MIEPTNRHPIATTSSRIVYENPWLRIREDKTLRYTDQEGIYGVIETKNSVCTCVINEKNELFLIYGYSYPTDTWSSQVPGGSGDDEHALEAAKRELREETGIEAKQLEQLGNLIVSCGLLTERMAVVVATNLEVRKRAEADDTDSIADGKFVSFDQVKNMIDSGDICDSQSISAIYLAQNWLSGRLATE